MFICLFTIPDDVRGAIPPRLTNHCSMNLLSITQTPINAHPGYGKSGPRRRHANANGRPGGVTGVGRRAVGASGEERERWHRHVVCGSSWYNMAVGRGRQRVRATGTQTHRRRARRVHMRTRVAARVKVLRATRTARRMPRLCSAQRSTRANHNSRSAASVVVK